MRSSMNAMAGVVLARHSLENVLGQLLSLTVDALPGCHGASMMFVDGADLAFRGDELIARVDDYQQEIGDGP